MNCLNNLHMMQSLSGLSLVELFVHSIGHWLVEPGVLLYECIDWYTIYQSVSLGPWTSLDHLPVSHDSF